MKKTKKFFSEIVVGEKLLMKVPQHFLRVGYSPKKNKVFLMADQKVIDSAQTLVKEFKKKRWEVELIKLNGGESLKEFDKIQSLAQKLHSLRADRDSVFVAMGGGSIGDCVGFLASIYMRGVDWVGIPTTFLSQIDSSIGGKTGVNIATGKNILGTFHQPKLVICDIVFLNSLPPREITSGIGEMLKYGIAFDKNFFKWIGKNIFLIEKRDSRALIKAIKTSLKIKSVIVENDPKEQRGIRDLLNFGHTFGHALESLTQYKSFLHGEAVIWGMKFAIILSMNKGLLNHKDGQSLLKVLGDLKVKKIPQTLKFEDLFLKIQQDKKARMGNMRFVLLTSIGVSMVDKSVKRDELKNAFDTLKRINSSEW